MSSYVEIGIDDTRRDFWHGSGSMDERGEFRRYLHLFTLRSEKKRESISSLFEHTVYPWINIWQKPDLEEIIAYSHMTEFTMFPAQWSFFWANLERLRALVANTLSNGQHGPYWMLMTGHSESHCACEMVNIKRRLGNELTKKMRSFEITNPVFEAALRDAMQPFLVLTPQQEIADEAHRSSQGRGSALSVWDGDSLGRPPRCR